MSDIQDLYNEMVKNRNAINEMKNLALQTGEYPAASALTGAELVRLMQGGVSKYVDADQLKNLGGTGEDNVQSNWNETNNGLDEFILNKPTLLSDFTDDIDAGVGEANVQADWDETDNGSDAFILNKPAITLTDWIEIDDAFVYKGTNTDKNAIEVGDMIKRYPTTSRYIHARVNSLPYTVESNLSFFEDINII